MEITVETLAEEVQGTIWGERNTVIHGAQAIEKAGPHEITFVSERSRLSLLRKSRAGAAIVEKGFSDLEGRPDVPRSLIFVNDAQLAFIHILQKFRSPHPRPEIGRSSEAWIGANVEIGENTNIYPGAYIADGVIIGEGCDIYPGVFLGFGCQLGDYVTVYPNAVLYPDVSVGCRVIIHSCAVLGADGFGYRFEAGRFEKIPQLGTVRIEDDVEIGAGTTIDRGMIGPTVIGQGTKIDDQVMIAHNCEIGSHNGFASQVGLAGSVTTGDYVRCAGQVGIADHVHIGDGATLLAQTGVHRDLPGGEMYAGAPARPKDEAFQYLKAQTRLPAMDKKVKSLVKQVEELRQQVEALSGAKSDNDS